MFEKLFCVLRQNGAKRNCPAILQNILKHGMGEQRVSEREREKMKESFDGWEQN